MRSTLLALLLTVSAANAATGISVSVNPSTRFAAIDLYDRPSDTGSPAESVRLYDALRGKSVASTGFDFTCIAPIADPAGNRFGRCTIAVSAGNPDVEIVTGRDESTVALRFVGPTARKIATALGVNSSVGEIFKTRDGAFAVRALGPGSIDIVAREVDLPDDH